MAFPRGPFPWLDEIPQARPPEMQKFVESRVNEGMITMLDPADIPPAALQLAKNCTVRFDKTSRRPGSRLLEPAKPNDEPVLKFAAVKMNDGTPHTIRMTPTTIHRISGGVWTALTDANVGGEELAGTITDRFNTAIILDNFVFSNNGANHIQKINFTTNEFARLGNAPKYRYICGFFNRVVGAAVRDDNEVQIGWSGDANIDEWDPLVDESAGFGPLVESPSDLSDFITGLFAWTNVMLVLREKSIWIATKQPIPQAPFDFKTVIPSIGCDCPSSAALIGLDGLAWFDYRTGTVYAYSVGGALERIGEKVERDIVRNVDDVEKVFSAYNPIHNEYTIYIPQAGSKWVAAWTYNLRGKTWVYNEYYDQTTADDIEIGSGGLTIDQLGPVPINTLEGTIDDLSPTASTLPTRVYGRGDGSGATEDVNVDTDAPHDDYPTGIIYQTEIVSKVFTIPEDDIYIAEIRIEYDATIGGPFEIQYSRTGGAGLDAWRTAKIVDPQVLEVPRIIKYRRLIKSRRFAWRLISERGLFGILSYEVHVYKAGKSNR